MVDWGGVCGGVNIDENKQHETTNGEEPTTRMSGDLKEGWKLQLDADGIK